jgi:hypothetical protein
MVVSGHWQIRIWLGLETIRERGSAVGRMKTMLLCQSCGGVVGSSAAQIEPEALIEDVRKFERDHGLEPRTVLIVCPRCGERSKLSIKSAPDQ